MTELTMKLKSDILALFEVAQRLQAAKGEPWSDSLASKLCFNHGEFVGNLRNWEGGLGSPGMQKVLQFERFLIDNIGPKEHAKFLKSRGLAPVKSTAGTASEAAPVDDWN